MQVTEHLIYLAGGTEEDVRAWRDGEADFDAEMLKEAADELGGLMGR